MRTAKEKPREGKVDMRRQKEAQTALVYFYYSRRWRVENLISEADIKGYIGNAYAMSP